MDVSADPAPPTSSSRARAVAIASGAAAALVMGGIVAFALTGPGTAGGAGGRPSTRGFSDAAGAQDFPETGCDVDPSKPPKLAFEVSDGGLEFGEVKQGVRIEKEVVFRNVGRGTLCVHKPTTGCGCVKAELVGDRHRYEPGETGAIKVTLLSEGKEGEQKKMVTLGSNDLESPMRSFPVHALITRGLVVVTERIDFGRGPVKEPVTADVILKSPKADPDWAVTAVVGGIHPDKTSVAYTFTVEDVPDPAFRFRRVHVTHPGLEKEGFFQDVVVIRTTHPERPEISLPAAYQVTPSILAYPAHLAMGYVQSGIPGSPMRVNLTARAPFKILEVWFERPGTAGPAAEGSGFKAPFGPRDQGDGWWVDVKYDGLSRKPGGLEATLVVKTDHPRMPEVRVPIRATVVAPR